MRSEMAAIESFYCEISKMIYKKLPSFYAISTFQFYFYD